MNDDYSLRILIIIVNHNAIEDEQL